MTKTKTVFMAIVFTLLAAPVAWAFSAELHNEDGKAYDYSLACGGSTTNGKINAHTTTSLGTGNCTLLVKGAGLGKVAPNVKCTIKGGTLTCK